MEDQIFIIDNNNELIELNESKFKSELIFQEVYGVPYQTSSKEDRNKTLNFGDTVTIIYSSKTPQMHEIKELKEYYGE